MTNQVSCKPYTGNAGNWYSWSAGTAEGNKGLGNEDNSICSRGWQMTVNDDTNTRSYYSLMYIIYNIQNINNDETIRYLPLSFVRSGNYHQGSLSYRSTDGFYWSSTSNAINNAYSLSFYSGNLSTRDNLDKRRGFAIRCVAR